DEDHVTSASAPTRRALVVRGGWDGHAPVAATDLFVPYLRTQGFAVDVHEDLEIYTDAVVMVGTDLIVQCWTMGTISPDQFHGLRTAVESGAGLAGWHGGIADSFRATSDYLHL